jgi:hypothetical protein
VGEDEEVGRRVGDKEVGMGQGRSTMGDKERAFRVGAAGLVLLVSCVLCVALSRSGGVAVLESVHERALTPQQVCPLLLLLLLLLFLWALLLCPFASCKFRKSKRLARSETEILSSCKFWIRRPTRRIRSFRTTFRGRLSN